MSLEPLPPLDAQLKGKLVDAALAAARGAYAPYSRFHVGAALLFDDGRVVTGANVENASYGLSLCAETVAVSGAMAAGARGGLVAMAVVGGVAGEGGAPTLGAEPVSPCGRCRQVLNEIAQLGGSDPLVVMVMAGNPHETVDMRLSALLPLAFGPASLG